MLITPRFILLLLAVILFGAAALQVPSSRVNLMASGLFLLALSMLLLP